MKPNQEIPPPPLPPPIRVIKGDKLVIKDIVEQEKQKRSLAKIKQREEKLTRKQFLKDCYKFWKEYKKVESPYFWWLEYLTVDFILFGKWEHFRKVRFNLPEQYLNDSWFSKKWETEWVLGVGYKFKRKSYPSDTFYWYP